MIQKETYLNIIDNSGVKKVCCIHIYGGYRKRYAKVGDIVLTSVKSMKKVGPECKFKKGDVVRVLILQTKNSKNSPFYNRAKHYENAGILISNTKKILGSRIFGSVDSMFRYSKFLKVVTIAKGLYK
jgi:large subunit ribosomal protein L14